MRVALVTCKRLPEPDFDEAPLVEALKRRGHEPVLLPWDDSGAATEQYRGRQGAGLHGVRTTKAGAAERFDIYVLRSTWNYYEAPDLFLAWVDQAAASAPFINPPDVVRWNIHKKYLAELQKQDIPIVPTRWYTRGDTIDLASLISQTGWEKLVIKPSISAGSYKTRLFDANELQESQAFANQLINERDVLVQRYMEGFREPGERSLVWIDGEWTHAVRKLPRFAGQVECVEASLPPQSAELAVAGAAIQCTEDSLSKMCSVSGRSSSSERTQVSQRPRGLKSAARSTCLAYARVDLVRDDTGSPVISEVELMEPSLYFPFSQRALDRFVRMIERMAGSS